MKMTAAAALLLGFLPAVLNAQPAHLAQQRGQLLFHYGIVPAEVVLAHAEGHAERAMHKGQAARGKKHIVLALFDASNGRRVADAEVMLHLTPAGGPSVTTTLEPMTIAGQAGYGAFVAMGAPGAYRIRFVVRRAGAAADAASAEFEHRVPGSEGGR